jgi:arsenical pump membrane protein
VLLLASTCLSPATLWAGVRGDPNAIEPFSILLLLYGLAYGCISIDVSGVLAWLASKLAARARTPLRLFLVVFGISSVFTVLTSNDVVILTLTPIVCDVCARLRRAPEPFLISMFFAANVWSALLIIGNPTNVIVGTSYQLGFAAYAAWMGIPSIAAGCTALAMVLLYFRHDFWPPVDAQPAQEMQALELSLSSDESTGDAEVAAEELKQPSPIAVHWLSAGVGLSCLFVTLAL